ncbi:MAG: DUF1624 domain-containing protein, partial [archaeon]|nr:DUF1624 domain-containing protein [archaeon]
MPRFWEIDFLRGIAIIMMIVFHLLWDLKYFNFIQGNIYSGFWGVFQIATASLFIFLAGVSLALSFSKHKGHTTPMIGRAGKILGAALGISLVTFILFPQSYIYFGILHFIGISILLGIPFANRKYISLALGLFVLLLPQFYNLPSLEIFSLMWVGLATPIPTLDYFSIFPWFGVVLLGIFAGNFFFENGKAKFKIKKPKIEG